MAMPTDVVVFKWRKKNFRREIGEIIFDPNSRCWSTRHSS